MPRRTPARPRRRGCARTLLAMAAAFVAGAAAVAVYQLVTWPDVAALARDNPSSTAFIDRFRRLHPDVPVRWTWTPYDRISPNLKRAVLVSEDINFFSHNGFDIRELKDAVKEAVEEREAPRGASTITQQVAKNLWLSPSRSPLRKAKEALLTVQLERRLSKRRILEIYLNVAEFGPGVFGAEAAARRYFGTTAALLSEEQAAELAAGLPKPSSWHPGSTSRVYRSHVARIVRRMDRAQWLWKVI